MQKIEAVNDFVVKFANINGSGSASANELFARAILRMGVPVSPRNIFPSNIQGLPTWFEVRVTEHGYLGRRGGVDMMVAMNPQTWDQDVREIDPGGYLFYDSSKPLPRAKFRDDIHVLGMPLTEICNDHYSDARERQLFKNIIYVGALTTLLDIDPAEIEKLFGEQYKGKEKLFDSNVQALNARARLRAPTSSRSRSRSSAATASATASSSTATAPPRSAASMAARRSVPGIRSPPRRRSPKLSALRTEAARRPGAGAHRYAIVQAEDELASIGMVIGAGWNGARSFTATSGPGISLMSEFIGLAYFAEIPAVLINVQRGGPSTGMPTRTQQADVLACAYASHGDTKHVLLFPEDPYECFEMSAQALDLAERLQTPVFVMSDLDIGMNQRLCRPFAWDDSREYDRGKVMTRENLDAGADFGRYLDVDGDGIPYRTYPGTHPTKGGYFTRGTTKNAYAGYSEAGADYIYNMQRLRRSSRPPSRWCRCRYSGGHDTRRAFAAIFYGSTGPAMHEALDALAEQGIYINALRIRAFPFQNEIADFIAAHSKVFVLEQNFDGQLTTLLVNEAGVNPASLIPVLHYDGTPITARFITQEIAERVSRLNVRPLRENMVA
jgi:2-oxoglutarate ferredoxin oxidoreductase subunit alpha